MGLLEKVRNFFYEEEDEEEQQEQEKPKKEKKIKEKVKIEYEEEKPKKEIKQKKHEEISERELFKADTTFNFPMDMDDTIFGTPKEDERVFEKTEKIDVYTKKEEPKETAYRGIKNYDSYASRYGVRKEEPKEEKKFKPTPVISPIYGVLDKNYKKEDLLIDSAKKNNDEETRIITYDSVRKKAYASVYENKEKDSIFYNLDEQTKEDETDDIDIDNDDVKIVYNDVDSYEEDKNKTIGEKIEEYERELEKDTTLDDDDFDEESKILSETKEQDLFNLIDNMYNSDEEEEDDE